MKVNQLYPAAAAHHPVRRDGRVDPARQQAGDAAAGSCRHAAGAGLLAEEVERLGRQHLDVDGQRRMREVHLPLSGLPDQPADFALDLR
jgi:hypothetical protein